MTSMGTFIKVHFGSHALLNDAIQQLKKFSNVSLEDLVEMIEQRVEDVDALKS